MNKNNPNSNYFFVNRELLHSSRWLSEPFTRGQAWIDLFGLAQHSKGYFRVRGIKIEVERGQLAYSQVTLAKRWKWSRNKVRRYLKELEKDKDMKQQNNEVTTIITILKYNDWQANDTAEGQQTIQQKDSRRTANDTHTKNDKNDKNVKKEEINTLRDIKSRHKSPTSKKPTNPDIKKFIDWWYQCFEKKFNEKYHVSGGKEGKLLKELLSKYPYDKLVVLGEKFFCSQDSFIKDSGYTIGVFASVINKLLAQETPKLDPDLYA